MCDVWQAVVGAWGTDPLDSNDGRASRQADAHLWHLPRLWGRLFSRLYEQLGLLAGGLTPRGEETLVRLSSWMPYAQAEELLQDLLGMQVSLATARRATLHTGEAALAVDEKEEERLKQEVPQAPGGADKQRLACGWSDGPPDRGRVGRSQNARAGGGHPQ